MTHLNIPLGWPDWVVIALYLVISLAIGLAYMRKGTASLNDYFVAGRKLGWFAVGTSIVATTFAADTPLAVANITRTSGFQGNWFWWNHAIAFLCCMIFFAPLWRRAKIMTDTELIELRYGGLPARILRMVLSLHKSCLVNTITMGWVILAMAKIVAEAFGWPKEQAIPVLIIIAVFYTVISGLWGVVMTDVFQFILALIGCYVLMFFVVHHLGGISAMTDKVLQTATAMQTAHPASRIAPPGQIMRFFPSWDAGTIAICTFFFYMTVQWWISAEGGGYIAQRLFSTRNERQAVFAMLWFVFLHLIVRAWPWIIVGLGSVVVFPSLADPESAYPRMMMMFLPAGFKGVMIASLMAAFMSTISTHLNWGASYLVNDIYKRYFKKEATDRHYILVSQCCVVLMAIMGSLAAWRMDSIFGGWVLVTEMGAGGVLASLLRWYWWRINAWAEISGIIGSIICSVVLRNLASVGGIVTHLGFTSFGGWVTSMDYLGTKDYYFIRFGTIIAVNTAIWLTVVALTRPVPIEKLTAFYRLARPGGWWKPVLKLHPELAINAVSGWRQLTALLVGICAMYLGLFGAGWVLTGKYWVGSVSIILTIGVGWLLVRLLSQLYQAEGVTADDPVAPESALSDPVAEPLASNVSA
jgi:SSS family transporter